MENVVRLVLTFQCILLKYNFYIGEYRCYILRINDQNRENVVIKYLNEWSELLLQSTT